MHLALMWYILYNVNNINNVFQQTFMYIQKIRNSFSMADELKKKFQEMQEAKHGRKSEIQVDEMEWIEVSDGA